jgi:arylsulfatase A-like enzyme
MAALLVSAAPPGPAPDPHGIRRVVVITLDTTRFDDLGCNGGLARTPTIDGVAARGMRYTNAIVVSPKTAPSVASFMTGRVSNRHGVYDVGTALDPSLTTIAEILRRRGFATGGFTSNPVVGRLDGDRRSAGFDQGFDVYETHFDTPQVAPGVEPNAAPRDHASLLVDAALSFVEKHEDDPFLLWMLHLDPHAPYAPPAPYDAMYLEHPDLLAASVALNAMQIHYRAYVTTRLRSHEYVARHLGAVSLVDHALQRLFDRLQALPGRTLLIITADHGESLGDVGVWFEHGTNLRAACVNVPLIVACEDTVPAGVSAALAANIDLAPTILDLLDIPLDELDGNGRSLVRTFTDADPWPQRMIPIQVHYGQTWRGVRSGRFCLQSQFEPTTGEHVRSFLFDARDDPRETTDVAPRYPEAFGSHFELARAWVARPPRQSIDLRHDPEVARRLRALGYVR